MGQVQLAGITKRFGDNEVIHPTDLAIEDGEFVVFVGPSGCGKSTMLRIIAGLEEATTGDVVIDGRVVNDVAPVDRGIAMVFQSYALYPHMSVFENIAFPLRVARLARREVEARVMRAAEILKLEDRLQYRPAQLSGGQRQRVAIGRAIVRQPSVFLFDEPLSNLDAALRTEMRVELSRLHGSLGNTMVYVTHDQVEAMTMATKIVVLRDGRIEQVGTPLELFHNPANVFVAGFIGTPRMNFLDARCNGAGDGVRVKLREAELTLPVAGAVDDGEAVTIGVRPDDLVLGGGEARFRVTPEVVEHLGNQSVVHGSDAAGHAICAMVPGSAPVVVGEPIEFGIEPRRAHLFRADGTALRRQA